MIRSIQRKLRFGLRGVAMLGLALGIACPLLQASKKKDQSALNRIQYVARLEQMDVESVPQHTMGSLWNPDNTLGDLSTDYKARHLNDTIVITVAVQTTAAQSGTSSYKRSVQTSSAITGLAGVINTNGLNPLLNANSNTQLSGGGATASNTTFQTVMTGQVIAVLPSGNLVVEAHRQIFMNNQHENITIRGVVRPGDIGTNNTISSAQLSDLQVEMKGKGIIADATRPLNPITKALLWLIGF
ncbi:MAG: flagellar basal body L-ring protein FlgH [Acidobacteriaceae bacterium]